MIFFLLNYPFFPLTSIISDGKNYQWSKKLKGNFRSYVTKDVLKILLSLFSVKPTICLNRHFISLLERNQFNQENTKKTEE